MNTIFDVDEALGRIRGNQKLLGTLLKMFLGGEEAGQMKVCLAQGDYEQAGHLAHAVKGIAGNLSLHQLFDYASELNEVLKTGKPDDALVSQFFSSLEITQQTVRDYLQTIS